MLDGLEHVYRVAGRDVGDDFVLVAVDDGDLADITLDDQEEVFPVAVVHGLGRVILGVDEDLVTLFHQSQRHLRRYRRHLLDVLGHHGDFVLRQDIVEVVHAAFSTVGNDLFQAGLTQFLGVLGLQVLAGGALAQGAVTAGAALEVDRLGLIELLRCHRRCVFGKRGAGLQSHA